MYAKFFKRIIDFICSLLLLPVVLVIILCMAPIIYIDDPGPIFFNGRRRGKDGIPFKMYKFRSMYVNSPDIKNVDGSTYNAEDDPRVTSIGKFMRKTSIDEIPQLLNVLFGDMSFIGPRPILAQTPYNQLSEIVKKRCSVKPGITGYAQAYFRNSITQAEKYRWDCYYVDNISFYLDIKILLKTFLVVIKRKNIFINKI